MKPKIPLILSLLSLCWLFSIQLVNAQCPGCGYNGASQWPPGTMSPVLGTPASEGCMWGGDHAVISVCSGATYTFSTCGNTEDTQLTLYTPGGATCLDYNDDICGFQSTITWVATFTGTVHLQVHEWPCVNATNCFSLVVTQTTACGGGGGGGNGDNCGSPIAVNCGDFLAGETTLGNGNNASTWSCLVNANPPFNLIATPGEDRFYAVTVTDPTVTILRLNLTNVVDNDGLIEVIYMGTSCTEGTCANSYQFDVALGAFAGGLTSTDFAIPGAGTYYFSIDSQGDGVTSYDIGFDCIASGIEFDMSGCGTDTDMDGYTITWNGGAPGAFSPGQTGTLCYTIYVMNPTGWEWLKYFDLELGACWTNPTNMTPTNPPVNNGWYNLTGEWDANIVAPDSVKWDFTNSNNPIWGDGNSGSFFCQPFTFCVDLTVDPGCTDSVDLTINMYIEDDAYGINASTQSGSQTAVTGFALNPILPVLYHSFNVVQNGNAVDLDWHTSSELNNRFFAIERSIDKVNFKEVGRVNGSATNPWGAMYDWTDVNPEAGVNHYRLRQIDFDGKSTFSDIESVVFMPTADFLVTGILPNPTNATSVLVLNSRKDGNLQMKVFDIMGKVHFRNEFQVAVGTNNLKVDLSDYPTGLYFIQIGDDDIFKIVKLIKK